MTDYTSEIYRLILSNISDAVFITDSIGEFTFICPNVNVIFGYTETEVAEFHNIVYLLGSELFDPDKLYHHGEISNIERQIKDKFGRRHDLLINVKLIKIENGVILYTCRDITQRKQAEEALQKNEAEYRQLFETMAQGVVYQNDQGEIIKANSAAMRLLGLTLDQMIGRTSIDPRWHTIYEDGSPFPGQEHPAMVALRTGEPVQDVVMGVFHPEKEAHVWIIVNAEPEFRPGETKPFQVFATFTDITERKQAEFSLRENQRFLGDIIEHSGSLIYVKRRDGSYQKVNRKWSEVVGLPQELVLGKTDAQLFPPQVAQQFREIDLEVFNSGHLIEQEEFLESPEGRRYFISIKFPIRDNDGSITGLSGMSTEITEQKQATLALEQSEANLKAILESSPESIWSVNTTYEVIYANPVLIQNFRNIFGASLSPGMNIIEALPDSLKPVWQARYDKVFQDKTLRFTEKFDLDDTHLYLDITMTPIRVTDKVIGAAVFSKDITKRKQSESALRASEESLRSIINSQTNYVLRTDTQGCYTYWNKKFKEEFGWLHSENGLKEANILESICEYHHQRTIETVKQCIANPGEIIQIELDKPTPDGSVRTTLWDFVCLTGSDNQPFEIQCMGIDITERKRAEQERLARQEAEAANRAKLAFLANMSHEIRTPLNAIIGFAQILERDKALGSRQLEQVQTIARSGEHLLALINDILDFSKIEADRVSLSPTNFCLYNLLDDMEIMFHLRAEAKGLQFLVERQPEALCYVTADEAKLRQILINLVGNAIKFTRIGKVILRVQTELMAGEAGTEDRIRLFVEVEDTGPGISDEDLEGVFDVFQQTEAGRLAGGTGLGLTISRRLVELMGGQLTVESQLGKGSCFQFFIFLQAAKEKPETRNKSLPQVIGLEPGTGPYHILVVDDKKDNRDLLQAMLEPVGFHIQEAINGEEAVEIFNHWSPQAVLMDIRMPVMDGYEATKRIKATVAGQAVPIIAVTASVFEEDELAMLASHHVDGYLRKPFKPAELFEMLRELLDIRYMLAEEVKIQVQPLTREALTVLPDELVRAMQQAVDEGDSLALKALIARVKSITVEVARGLQLLADKYDYEQLNNLLQREGNLSNG